MADILVVGLNPAWQRVLSAPAFRLHAINRVDEKWELASGKGLNAAKALTRLGHRVTLWQIIAGENGRRCVSAAEAWGMESRHAETEGNTRVCTTLIHTGGNCTEIIEPFAVDDATMEQRLLDAVSVNSAFDATLICGSIPAGIAESIYARMLARVRPGLLFWDSVMGFQPEFLPPITWMKVNAEEYSRLKPGSKIPVLITAGADPAQVLHTHAADGWYRLPPSNRIYNPIGSGDAVLAGLADGMVRGQSPAASVRAALAIGMASCFTLLPSEWDSADAAAIAATIESTTP